MGVTFFYYVGSGDHTQVVRLAIKCFCWLSCLTSLLLHCSSFAVEKAPHLYAYILHSG